MLLAGLQVDVVDTGRQSVSIHVDAGHEAVWPDLVVPGAQRRRDMGVGAMTLGVNLASITGAEAAVDAGRPCVAQRALVCAREDPRRVRERIQSHLRRCIVKHLAADRQGVRRQWIGSGAGRLERVPALQDLAVQVPGRAGGPDVVLEGIIVRLQLVIGDRPVLDRHPFRDLVLAVALDIVAEVLEVLGHESPQPCRPVDAGATDPSTGMKGSELADRQRRRLWVRPPCPRLAGDVVHQGFMHFVLQRVVVVLEIGVRISHRTCFQRDNLAGRRSRASSRECQRSNRPRS